MKTIAWLQLIISILLTFLLGKVISSLFPQSGDAFGVFLLFFLLATFLFAVGRITGVSLPNKYGGKVYKVNRGFKGYWKEVLLSFLFSLGIALIVLMGK